MFYNVLTKSCKEGLDTKKLLLIIFKSFGFILICLEKRSHYRKHTEKIPMIFNLP